MENRLWYNNPSTDWFEGLPIGNGRIAAMITCDKDTDVLHLNHEWLWRGVNKNRDNGNVSEHLDEVRTLLKEGEFFKATSMANTYFGGVGGISGIPNRVDAYQPAGNLCFEIDNVDLFKERELDINNGVVYAERTSENNNINSAFIAHPTINNIICRWCGSETFSGELSFLRTDDADAIDRINATSSGIFYECSFKGGISFKIAITVKTDGNATSDGKNILIKDAKELLLFVNIATDVKGIEAELQAYPIPNDTVWCELFNSHKEIFSKCMSEFQLNIDAPEGCLPTDERINRLRAGEKDISLPLLYFNFGRYLLISSSLCGELPANLQGKWNNDITPPWNCDYHFNINIQMNYWMAEAVNMSYCVEALIKYTERFIPHAKKAANDLYGCRGIYLPLQGDAWSRSTPESFGWAVWIGAAPWIAQHLWWHYEYNGDREFLQNRAYPFFKEVAEFYEDYLVEDEFGVIQIMPSQSPENRFSGTGLFPVSIGISSALDVQLAFDALGYAINSAKILKMDINKIELWESLRNKLPDFKIGKDGRLLEWDSEREEVELGHRHLSHLYGLYPSNIFNPIDRPNQYNAAIKSLDYRLMQGGGYTGWSRAWVACLYARIGDKNKTWEHLNALIKDFSTISLLDLHPPRIFQIDGNLGAVAAVVESIAQFWAGKLHLLRALPNEWSCGSMYGLKVPGGHTVGLEWKNGKLVELEVIIGFSKELIICIGEDNDIAITGELGQKVNRKIADKI